MSLILVEIIGITLPSTKQRCRIKIIKKLMSGSISSSSDSLPLSSWSILCCTLSLHQNKQNQGFHKFCLITISNMTGKKITFYSFVEYGNSKSTEFKLHNVFNTQ